MKRIMPGLLAALLAVSAQAANDTPYRGQQERDIKALSSSEIDGYLQGSGMGFAKAAELNHYPGPRHVLDLAGPLALTPEQVARSQALYDRMNSAAVALGRKLVEKERELDRAFADEAVNARNLEALLGEIGALQARLRFVHLSAHLEQRALLTASQIRHYDRLRGYENGNGGDHQHKH